MSVPIVPEMWLSGRELSEPRQSPDGSLVAWVVGWGPRTAIVIRRLGGTEPERAVTSMPEPRPGRGVGGGCFDWTPDGAALIYAGRDGGLWQVAVGGGPPRCLVPGDPTAGVQSPAVSPDGGRVAYVVEMASIHYVSMEDGAIERVPTDADFVTDPAWSPDGETLLWQQWSVPAMAWDRSSIGCWRVGDATAGELVTSARGWKADGQRRHDRTAALGAGDVQVQQLQCSDDGALWSVSDADGWLNVCVDGVPVHAEDHEHAGPTWGPGQRSYAVSPDGGSVAICRNEGGFGRLIIVDRRSGEVRQLGRGVHGQVSWRGRWITALRSGAKTPTQIVAYDVVTGARTELARGPVAGFDDSNLVEPECVEWLADDGVTVHGRLYRAEAGDGRLICWIHGGPTDQWVVGFLPRIAYWVQRGWSVLVPDHRGSTGHGRGYQQAMRERWGELDDSDTAAGIRAAHANGWGLADRTVAMGSSAGGLTVLNLCRRHSSLVRAAVVLYPVSDLAALDATTHRFEAHYNATLVGSGEAAARRYDERSPLHHAHQISTPLLIFHGTDDPVVSVEQSRQMVAAMQTAGRTVTYVEYPGEGHGFRVVDNQLDEVRQTIEFLDHTIGLAPER